MQVKAKLKNLRISPRKVRLVSNFINGMDVEGAQTQLRFLSKKSSESILKLLNSAISNAKNNFKLSGNNLYISNITVDEGPAMKRWRPRAMGRAFAIKKRNSCVTIVLDEAKKTKKESKKERKTSDIKIEEKPAIQKLPENKKTKEIKSIKKDNKETVVAEKEKE